MNISLQNRFGWQAHEALFLPWLGLMCLGWIMVTSASTEIAEFYTGNAAYFSIRHAVYVVLGIITTYAFSQIPMTYWAKVDVFMLLAAVVGLGLVFVPGIGHEVNGSQRWLNLGIIKIQASELAKFAAVFYIAGYLVRRQDEVQQSWSGFIKPLTILGAMVFLLLLEPDFGAVVVLMGAVLIQLFLGGVKAGQFFLLLIATLIISAIVLTSESYRMERLMAYLDPWAPEHVYGTGYQLTQSLIAFGRGDWFGVGLGESVQKLFYLPEAHTDFVFAIWAEETGLAGAAAALGLLIFAIAVIWQVAWKAQQKGQQYAAYVAIGIASLLGLQAVINLGVNIGLLPTKGLTLPFFSYGGSSLLVCCVMVGVVMRIAHETYAVQEVADD
ncbi:MAG: putative lipid II flippase FtsW [Oceanospirillaceae bacterium]|uniref:putative lipid II flippase FtsW n=1 Tax=unclassified Thalassolituus TaxID=2624967 RepID=UPI000C43D980|nr:MULTISPECIES: putative lipid II flippase FtsW [unclassified Thalassolituus]MAS25080.1 putative lipid II flippase FtsW [Oceanospirillaceae bacterium]MAX98338.1 putative lipid II flippase FtsW [Oceanospirillaceae bacterium]MBL34715.1 putative lipid II flippase FtsW [Oceanospirillaceae bacterium]MBS54138.1 putative lipid II flippase FtsW [Oceanospirillaceae bacterium]|tara:strand:- start:482 stop:1633 length:1152 start_codon:yes stop_codon:yes gene_type:complete